MFTFFLIALVLSVLSVSLAILVVFTNMLKLDRLPRLLMAFSVFGNVCAMCASINSILDLPITSYIMVEAFFFCVLVICIYTVIRLLVILLTSIGTVIVLDAYFNVPTSLVVDASVGEERDGQQ